MKTNRGANPEAVVARASRPCVHSASDATKIEPRITRIDADKNFLHLRYPRNPRLILLFPRLGRLVNSRSIVREQEPNILLAKPWDRHHD